MFYKVQIYDNSLMVHRFAEHTIITVLPGGCLPAKTCDPAVYCRNRSRSS